MLSDSFLDGFMEFLDSTKADLRGTSLAFWTRLMRESFLAYSVLLPWFRLFLAGGGANELPSGFYSLLLDLLSELSALLTISAIIFLSGGSDLLRSLFLEVCSVFSID